MESPEEDDEPARGFWGELGRTARYALDNDARTARLAVLMMIYEIIWHATL